MSYILDALRKSDQKRQQATAPTLMSAPIPVEEAGQRKLTPVAAIAGALFVAGVVIGWWAPWQSEPTKPGAEARLAAKVERAAPAPALIPLPPAAVAEPARPNRPSPAAPAVTTPVEQVPKAAVAPTAMSAPPAPAARPEKKPDMPSEAAATLVARTELPAVLQQELPKIAVSMHAYSAQPRNRLVSVNDQLLHEGDSLSPGLVLEQIRADDMVFSYKGFRFRQALQ